MSLSNLNKDNVMSLFKMIHNNDDMQQIVHSVKNNYASYARLELIAKQMKMLQNEAEHILLHHQYNLDFQKMECRFKKVPGTMYYVFENGNKDRFLSMIPPEKWNVLPGVFITKVYYDFDCQFYVQTDVDDSIHS